MEVIQITKVNKLYNLLKLLSTHHYSYNPIIKHRRASKRIQQADTVYFHCDTMPTHPRYTHFMHTHKQDSLGGGKIKVTANIY